MQIDNNTDPELMRVAHNITSWAKEQGITMRELSERTQVPYTYLLGAERGAVSGKITMRHLDTISRFFSKKIHELFS